MKKGLFLVGIVAGLLVAESTHACRVVMPRPVDPNKSVRPASVLTRKHKVKIEVTENIAVITVEAVFKNPNPFAVTGTYVFPLPEGVVVSRFQIDVGGRRIEGKIMEKEKAREMFINAARKYKNPALLEFLNYKLIRCQVANIPPNGEVTLRLSYTQELKETLGTLELTYPITSARNPDGTPISVVTITFSAKSQIPIRGVYSPIYPLDVRRISENEVRASYEGQNIDPQKDLRLYIRRSKKEIGLICLAHRPQKDQPGYFMLLFSPKLKWDIKKVLPKDFIFVLDVSGSMRGRKIAQAKKALEFCIRSLNPKDRFNIVLFNNQVRTWKDGLLEANRNNIDEAVQFVRAINANGGTNINGALLKAMSLLTTQKERLPMVVFLTDGLPTAGVTDPKQIIENVTNANKSNARLFVFGVGYDVNTFLLDKLAENNRGDREYVEPNENIEVKVSSLYAKIATPVLSDITVDFSFETEDLYPRRLPDLFRGNKIIIFGRYKECGKQTVTLKGNLLGEQKTYTYTINLPESTDTNDFLPRLWAKRKIGWMIDRLRLGNLNKNQRKELEEEVKRLAKKFGIATPWTSFYAEDKGAAFARRKHVGKVFGASRGAGGKVAPAAAPAAKPHPAPGAGAVQASKKAKLLRHAEALEKDAVEGRLKNIRTIGNKVFKYNEKEKIWIDNDYNEKLHKDKLITVKFLSKQYLDLIAKYKDLPKYLALGETVIVVLEGKPYKFENR